MTGADEIRVRVLPARTVTVGGRHYVAGDEFDVTADEAAALGRQGFVAIVVPDGLVTSRVRLA